MELAGDTREKEHRRKRGGKGKERESKEEEKENEKKAHGTCGGYKGKGTQKGKGRKGKGTRRQRGRKGENEEGTGTKPLQPGSDGILRANNLDSDGDRGHENEGRQGGQNQDGKGEVARQGKAREGEDLGGGTEGGCGKRWQDKMEAGKCRNKQARNKVKEHKYIRKGRRSKMKHQGKGAGGQCTRQRNKTIELECAGWRTQRRAKDDGSGTERNRGGRRNREDKWRAEDSDPRARNRMADAVQDAAREWKVTR